VKGENIFLRKRGLTQKKGWEPLIYGTKCPQNSNAPAMRRAETSKTPVLGKFTFYMN